MELHKNMTISQFNNGYWYAVQLKKFAKEIGIENSSRLRKDELEKLIKIYLQTGKITQAKRKVIPLTAQKDSDIGLSSNLKINCFTNNDVTWKFLHDEARKIDTDFSLQSGTKYRLNRWRDDQLIQGNAITYGDLAQAFVHINNSKKTRKRIEGTYYMYFLDDYLKNEPNATHAEAIEAWHALKTMNIPKTYKDWNSVIDKS